MSRPKGLRDEKTETLERVIAEVASSESEAAMLKRHFGGALRQRPPGFWQKLADVAKKMSEIVTERPCVLIVEPKTGAVVEATAAVATQKIVNDGFRVATPDEAFAFEKRRARADSQPA